MTDLEGVAGVFSFEEYTTPKGRWYDLSRKLLTQEVNAAIEGALESGADEILVVDGHGYTGINIEELNEEAKLLSGRPLLLPWELDKGFNAAFIVGQHAMAGVEKAHLSHTESHTAIQNVWINGIKVGEIAIVAAVAGYFNIPVVLVTGDKAACLEAKSFIPQVETVAVKEGITHGAAISITPTKARKMIREGARNALRKIAEVKPYKVETPIELKIEFTEESKSFAEVLSNRSYVEKIDTRTIKIRDDDLLSALKKWWL
ncbi:MAG: M55 family metallopeptidase [Candidatus Brockarchaeota archaeon]|nr:M55 family metallopeptidase [Candidatus Brockarchaeota archaeon]